MDCIGSISGAQVIYPYAHRLVKKRKASPLAQVLGTTVPADLKGFLEALRWEDTPTDEKRLALQRENPDLVHATTFRTATYIHEAFKAVVHTQGLNMFDVYAVLTATYVEACGFDAKTFSTTYDPDKPLKPWETQELPRQSVPDDLSGWLEMLRWEATPIGDKRRTLGHRQPGQVVSITIKTPAYLHRLLEEAIKSQQLILSDVYSVLAVTYVESHGIDITRERPDVDDQSE